jgi:ubiquinone/menaquinone biosynthesis C-methylase UbiE
MSRFDAAAPTYDAHRGLPGGVVETIRAAVLDAIGAPRRPRVLDLGAGSGRIGRAFVAAGDDYVAVDLSAGMLREFSRRADTGGRRAGLVRADGQRLPFADAAFDAVMLVQVFGGLGDWRPFIGEARRVLRSHGAMLLGRSVMPDDGVDARMKAQLASILGEMGVAPDPNNVRDDVQEWLASIAAGRARVVASTWSAARTPRGFVERHRTGARFAPLPEPIKDEAMRRLETWAVATFGSLDAPASEQHAFELRVFTFADEVTR